MSRFFIGLMRFRLAAFSLCAGCLIISLFQSGSIARTPGRQKALPQVSIDKTKHDFGEVYAGEELDIVFTVRNTGTAPLELSQSASHVGRLASPRGSFIRAASFTSRPAMSAAPS